MLLPLLVACNKESSDNTATTEETTAEAVESEAETMIKINPSDYVVIYPNDSFKEKYLALLASNSFGVSYLPDASSPERECEILVGETDRPESRQVLENKGENDIIIAVVNKKIVLWASDDELYEILMYRLKSLITDEGLPSDLYVAQSTKALNKVAESFPKDSALSFTALLMNKESHIEIRFGGGYVIGIDKNGVGLYTQEKKRTELAYKIIPSEIGKTYEVFCHFDGEYLRAYLNDPASGLAPWYAFELKTPDLAGEVRVGETTGYGAELSAPVIESISLATDGLTYQNNVIQNAADPDIIYHDGYYYMYVTGDKYPVYRSADLAKWEYVGVALPEVSWNIDKRYMWAPDVEYIGGKFYMAVSMGEAGFGIAVADKPEGPFVCAGDMPFLTKTIDGHIFVDDDGRIYLYYTSWCDGRAYGIWGVEMESDCLTPKWETEKLIFTPTEPWENTMNRGGVVEAPYMLKKEGVYYLVYSGSHFEADYAVGYATSTSPLEGFVKSANNPILRGTADTRGTGHCSIIETHLGGLMMVYHTHNNPTTVQPRHVAIDPVRFVKTADGYRLEVCGPTTSKTPVSVFE